MYQLIYVSKTLLQDAERIIVVKENQRASICFFFLLMFNESNINIKLYAGAISLLT